MSDLTTWLRRRLDEDERVARTAASFPYEVPSDAPWERERIIADRLGGRSRAVSAHRIVATFANPARVLAEVDAKRRIIDRYEDALSRQTDPEHSFIAADVQVTEYEDWVLPLLAMPYADRPGYRKEWRP